MVVMADAVRLLTIHTQPSKDSDVEEEDELALAFYLLRVDGTMAPT
jgi:hypothetical protein